MPFTDADERHQQELMRELDRQVAKSWEKQRDAFLLRLKGGVFPGTSAHGTTDHD